MARGRNLGDRSVTARHHLRAAHPRLEELETRLVLSLPVPDHVVVVMEENHAYSQIIGSSSAPYINSLANAGALFTQSYAIEHPSEPNYLDFFSGSNQGITSDACPVGSFSKPNLGSEVIGAGLTYASYSESMPSIGYTGCTSGEYARKHNPSPDFSNVPAADNQRFADFPSDFTKLPTYSFIDPNLLDDMHDGTIAQGDTWLKNNLQNYINWTQQHNSLFILTFDEDDSSHGNQIATIFLGPMVQPGNYSEHINHYSILRTVEDMYGLPYAGNSANVSPITDVWASPAVDHFSVVTDAANPDIAGTPFDVTVTAQDVNGNTVTGYTGTVTFSSQDPYGASLPGDYQFTPADQGSHTFYGVTALYTVGTWDVTATDTVSGATGSAFVNVQAAPAVAFQVIAPASVTAGTFFDVTVVAVDPYGNTDTNYQGTTHFSTSDPDGRVVLPPDYTFAPGDQGMVTFPGGVSLYTPGDQTLTVTDPGSGITGSATINVTTGPQSGPGTNLGRGVSMVVLGQAPAPAAVSSPAETDGATSTLGSQGGHWFFTVAEGSQGWVLPHRQAAADLLALLEPGRDSLGPWWALTDPLTV
jgi:hypothetical protein